MRTREGLFALAGGIVGAAVACGSIRVSAALSGSAVSDDASAAPVGAASAGPPDQDDAAGDPMLVANENLSRNLQECSRNLRALLDDKAQLAREIDSERTAEADASRAARARRIARRDLSKDDWKQLASVGSVRYTLPCASFNPAPEVLDRLGLAPRDVPLVQSAFAAARDAAWTQIRPLCATAVGGAEAADRLGLDSCPEMILDAEKVTSPADADRAMRAVGAVKAGLAEPSAIPAGDPVGAALLVLTGVAKDAERRLGSVLGPEDARVIVYGSGTCSRISEFTSSVPGADR
jgi:hypothetical protein